MRSIPLRIVAFMLVGLSLTSVLADEETSRLENDGKRLGQLLGPACDLVESITGTTFEQRPSVRVSDPETVARVLIAEFSALPEVALPKAGRRQVAEALAHALLAKYDPRANVIHILPDMVATLRDLKPYALDLKRAHMHLLLVHEATHALDFQRYDLEQSREHLESTDALQAVGAITEGHAQWVAEQAAKRLELTAAFEELTGAIVGTRNEGTERETPQMAALLSPVRFAYVAGHKFISAVAKARGLKGVEAVLRNPPQQSRLIEHPEAYLHPVKTDRADLGALVDAFRPLVEDEAWQVQSLRVLEATLRSQASRVPEERRAEFLKGYVDAHLLVGAVPGEDVQIVALVLQFDTPADARLFVELEKLVVEAAPGATPGVKMETMALTDGAGTGAAIPGFFMHRIVHLGAQAVALRQEVFHVGRFTAELIVTNIPSFDREVLDPIVDYAAAVIRDPDTRDKLEQPAASPFPRTKRVVTLKILDPEGKPVPRADVMVVIGSDDNPSLQRAACAEGVCRLSVGARRTRVMVGRATDADGEALDLAPSEPLEIEADATTLVVRLPRGLRIEGRVLTIEGDPAPDMRVVARPVPRTGPMPVGPSVRANTRDDGSFALIGLSDTTYDIHVAKAGMPRESGVSFPNQAAGSHGVELRLRAVRSVAVTVVDPEGVPVSSAAVQAMAHGDGASTGGVTNEQGVAQLHGLEPSKTYTLTVEFPFPDSRDDLAKHSQTGWVPADARIVLSPGWTLRGVVVDGEGKPVGGVVYRRLPNGWQSESTSPEGEFELRGLPAGPTFVAALRAPPDQTRDLRKKLPWQTVAQTTEPVQLALATFGEARTASLQVVDPSGKPVPGAHVTLSRTTARGPSGHMSLGLLDAQTDSKGRVPLPDLTGPGALELEITPPRERTTLLPRVLRDWKPTGAAIRLRRGYTITGVVRDERGPVLRALISIDPDPDAEQPEERVLVGMTDHRGRFETRLVPHGVVHLQAERERRDPGGLVNVSSLVDVTPDAPEASLALPARDGSIRLRGPAALAERKGYVIDASGGRGTIRFQAGGAAEIKGLVQGSYDIFVPAVNGTGTCAYLQGVATSTEEVALSLVDSIEIRFRVRAPDGAKDLYAGVRGPAGWFFKAPPDEAGIFIAGGLPPGRWPIEAAALVRGAPFAATGEAGVGETPLLVLEARPLR